MNPDRTFGGFKKHHKAGSLKPMPGVTTFDPVNKIFRTKPIVEQKSDQIWMTCTPPPPPTPRVPHNTPETDSDEHQFSHMEDAGVWKEDSQVQTMPEDYSDENQETEDQSQDSTYRPKKIRCRGLLPPRRKMTAYKIQTFRQKIRPILYKLDKETGRNKKTVSAKPADNVTAGLIDYQRDVDVGSGMNLVEVAAVLRDDAKGSEASFSDILVKLRPIPLHQALEMERILLASEEEFSMIKDNGCELGPVRNFQ